MDDVVVEPEWEEQSDQQIEDDLEDEADQSSDVIEIERKPEMTDAEVRARWPQRDVEEDDAYEHRIVRIKMILPTMWAAGRSGNPKGLLKKHATIKDALESALGEAVEFTDLKGTFKRTTRKAKFAKLYIEMLTEGGIWFGEGEYRRFVQLSGKEWVENALKMMRYVEPVKTNAPVKEVTKVSFDMTTLLPTSIKRTLIVERTGTLPEFDEEPEYIDVEATDGSTDLSIQ